MKIRRTMMTLSIALGTLLAVAPPSFGAEKTPDAKEIALLAKEARTPEDHTEVAKAYLAQAKALEAKADKLEREARKSDQPGPTAAMKQKWPALIVNARERKERVAMQSRRAAQESYRLAEHHSKQAGRTLDQIAALD